MQKVITITTHTNIIGNGGKTYVANEYEEINDLLEDGYRVIQVIPISDGSDNSFRYSLTFVLEKS